MINRTLFQRLRKLHELIAEEKTGSPRELANKLNVSERQLYEYLKTLKELGAPLKYEATRKTYYYEGEVLYQFLQFVPVKNTNDNNLRAIKHKPRE